jgi:hypothetical protein
MDACAAQQTKEDGLGLIVAMMPQNKPVAGNAGKRGMTSDAGRFCQSSGVIAGHFNSEHMQGNIALLTKPGAEILPFVSRRVKPVMDVCDLQRISEPLPQDVKHIEQYDRVHPSGKCAAQAMAGIDARCGQCCASGVKYSCHG